MIKIWLITILQLITKKKKICFQVFLNLFLFICTLERLMLSQCRCMTANVVIFRHFAFFLIFYDSKWRHILLKN